MWRQGKSWNSCKALVIILTSVESLLSAVTMANFLLAFDFQSVALHPALLHVYNDFTYLFMNILFSCSIYLTVMLDLEWYLSLIHI